MSRTPLPSRSAATLSRNLSSSSWRTTSSALYHNQILDIESLRCQRCVPVQHRESPRPQRVWLHATKFVYDKGCPSPLQLQCCHLQKNVSKMRLHFRVPTCRRVTDQFNTSEQEICHSTILRRAPAPSLCWLKPLLMSSAISTTKRVTMVDDAASDLVKTTLQNRQLSWSEHGSGLTQILHVHARE